VSGASNKRKRQNEAAAARAIASARGKRNDTAWFITAIVVVVVVAVAVIGGVLLHNYRSSQAAETVVPAQTVKGSDQYPVQVDRQDATVLVGKPTAKVTVDLYEDFLCPICGEFESTNFNSIEQQLQAGTVKVRYHMLNLLDSHSTPPGYSLMAANTALAVATVAPDKFISFHYSLYQKQPSEGGPGWTQEQLTNLANRLGVSGPQFTALVNSKAYEGQINTNLNNAEKDPALQQQSSEGSGFGTPTVVANGKVVNWQADPTWLTDLAKSAG
jgi:protein-disulfide isomerase